MKYVFVVLLFLTLTSCESYTYIKTNVKGVVTSKDTIPEHTKFEYHYGYSLMSGKFCWHWGNNHHDTEYVTNIRVENTDITQGKTNKNIGDSIDLIKTKVIEKDKLLDIRYSVR